MATKGQRFRKYTVEFKEMVVKRNIYEGISITALSEEYEINGSLIRAWRTLYLAKGQEGLAPKKKGNPKGRPKKNFSSELERLQHENARLKLENLRLKKLQVLLRGNAD